MKEGVILGAFITKEKVIPYIHDVNLKPYLETNETELITELTDLHRLLLTLKGYQIHIAVLMGVTEEGELIRAQIKIHWRDFFRFSYRKKINKQSLRLLNQIVNKTQKALTKLVMEKLNESNS